MSAGTWAIASASGTIYVEGAVRLEYRWKGGERVPCAVVGEHVFELEPGTIVLPVESMRSSGS